MPTILDACGAECRTLLSGAHLTTQSGSPSIVSDIKAAGDYALYLPSNSRVSWSFNGVGGQGTVARCFVYFKNLPSLNNFPVFLGWNPAWGMVYKTADQSIYLTNGTAYSTSGIPVQTGRWYLLDLRIPTNFTTGSIDGRVNGVALPTLAYSGLTPTNETAMQMGSSTAWTGDIYYDDFARSNTTTDYPLGGGDTLYNSIMADGTHNIAGTGDFQRGTTGTDILNATINAYLLAYDSPPLITSITASDSIAAILPANPTTDYVECKIAAKLASHTPLFGPRHISAIAAHHQSATQAGSWEMRIADNGVASQLMIFSGNGVTSLSYLKGVFGGDPPSAAAAWHVLNDATNGDWLNARMRYYGIDAAPDQFLDQIIFEIEVPTPTISQRAFGFYSDGTETGSTTLAAQDTNITINTAGGNQVVLLRVRAQEFSGTAGFSTDDYQLYLSKNGATALPIVPLIEAQTNTGSFGTWTTTRTINGQSFKGDGRKLGQAVFGLMKVGSPTGNMVAQLYAHTGTYRSSGSMATGSPLAVSAPIDVSTLTGSYVDKTFTFSGADQITLDKDTAYVIAFAYTGADASNYPQCRATGASPVPSGSLCTYTSGVWAGNHPSALVVKVNAASYGVLPYLSANLTEGEATTRRLTVGTGTFVAGKVAEDAEVNDLQLTASNYTELLYALEIDASVLAQGDTLDFIVNRNKLGILPTVYPRINITAPTIVNLSGTATGAGVATGTVRKVDVLSGAPAGLSVASGTLRLPLTVGLSSYWAFDEASGDALDSHGSVNLPQVGGTIGTGTGRVGTARDIEVDTNQFFGGGAYPSLAVGDFDFTLAAWIKAESFPDVAQIMRRNFAGGNSGYEYMLVAHSSGATFYVSHDGAPTGLVGVSYSATLSTGVWYLLIAWHDSVNNTINIQVGNNAPVSLAHSLGVYGNVAVPFYIGNAGGYGQGLDGLIDEVGYWTRKLSTQEREWLYNEGAGRAYSELATSMSAPTKQLSGSATGAGVASGTIRRVLKLSGTVTGGGVASGTLKLTKRIAGTVTATGVSSGTVRLVKPMLGSTTGAGVASGTIRKIQALTGSTTGGGVSSGGVKVYKKLLGSTTGGGVASGTVRRTLYLTGTIAVTSTASGTITHRVMRALSGSAVGGGVMSGTARRIVKMSGSAVGDGIPTGSITHRAMKALAGTVTANATASGTVTVIVGGNVKQMAGAITGGSIASGTIQRVLKMAGTITGVATTVGTIRRVLKMAGTINGVGTSSAVMKLTKPLSGAPASSSIASGVAKVTYKLSGTVNGVATSSGTLKLTKRFTGSVTGAGVTTGNVKITFKLSGSSTGGSVSTGGVKLTKRLIGSVTANATAQGVAKVTYKVTGSAIGAATVTGNLSVITVGQVKLDGFGIGATILSGGLKVYKKISGSSVGAAVTTGTIRRVLYVAGNVTGNATASGSVRLTKPLLGSTVGAGVASATMKATKNLTGLGLGSGVGNGQLVLTKRFVGNVQGVSTVTGNLSVSTPSLNIQLSGFVVAGGVSQGTLKLIKKLSGAADSGGIALGNIKLTKPLLGTINGTGVINGTNYFRRQLTGNITGNAVTSGTLKLKKSLSGNVVGNGYAQGGMGAIILKLSGSTIGTANVQGGFYIARKLGGNIVAGASVNGGMYVLKPLFGSSLGAGTLLGILTIGEPATEFEVLWLSDEGQIFKGASGIELLDGMGIAEVEKI